MSLIVSSPCYNLSKLLFSSYLQKRESDGAVLASIHETIFLRAESNRRVAQVAVVQCKKGTARLGDPGETARLWKVSHAD